MFELILAVSVLAQVSAEPEYPSDIVVTAASALERGDVSTLDDMRFRAYGLDNKPMPTAELAVLLSGCDALATDASTTRPVRLRYRCESLNAPMGPCDSDVLIVDVNRATSPDVYGTLYFERSNRPECKLPMVPAPQ